MLIFPHGKRRVVSRLSFVGERRERNCFEVQLKQDYYQRGVRRMGEKGEG